MDRSSEHLRRLDDLLDQLLQLEPAERSIRLAALRDGEPTLARELERLLQLCTEPDPALAPAGALRGSLAQECLMAAGAAPALEAGSRIGPYVIDALVGRGGMSEVYRAARQFEGFTQPVALKIVRADRPEVDLREHLQAEQRTLAGLNHPNIARFLDAGSAPDGATFLAMELVDDALPIDRYCQRHGLAPRERLVLFLQAARAVAYAHANLVVHCDIKPSNVLVDAGGHPKLVDFGISRLMATAAADGADPESDASPVTYGYASPEQLAGEPVGVASDVFQLGLLLHVLLTGRKPGAAPAAAQADPRPLRRLMQGDLGLVIARATARDPADRYASVSQFVDDVGNVLDARPVLARGYGPGYVVSLFVRRHAAVSAVVLALLASLVVFSVVVSGLAVSLEKERTRALKQRSVTAQAFDFMIQRFRELEPAKSGRDGSLVKEALDRAAAAPASRFGAEGEEVAELHALLGRGYLLLQEYDESLAQYEAMYQRALAMPPAQRVAYEDRALIGIGNASQFLRRTDAAREAFEKVAGLAPGDPSARVARAAALANLAGIYAGEGNVPQARAVMATHVLPVLERELGPRHPSVFAARSNDVRFLMGEERRSPPQDLALCARLVGELADEAEVALGAESEIAVRIRLDEYWALAHLGQHERAIRGLRATLPRARKVLGDDHLNVIISHRILGVALAASGRVDEGLAELDEALAAMERKFPPTHPNLGWTRFDHAVVLALAGRDEEAIAALQASGIGAGQIRGEPHLQRLQGDPRIAALLAGD